MRERRALALYRAIALGLLHGPTELLPVSSSAHTTLVPWLAGWSYRELDPDLRKSFEVSLHTGTAAALLLRAPAVRCGGRSSFLIAATAPPALAGYALGEQIERRLGTPATILAGLLAGSAAMIGAELLSCARAGKARKTVTRSGEETSGSPHMHNAHTDPSIDTTPQDGLALGLAQALALIPGVSRSGATIATARARGFSRLEADRLSWTIGLPVIMGATLLQGTRLARRGVPHELRLPLAAGAAGAFVSTLASTRLLTAERRARLLPACTAYRTGLAWLVIRRMRDNTS
jgi:undecaprenyl-diphosphatase